MRFSSPSDLCWVIGLTPQGRWIAPVLRAAVKLEWPEAEQVAASRLGDASLAQQLMEQAIQQTQEHLETMPPADVEQARKVLGRYYRNAVQRWRRSQSRLVYRGSSADIETLSASTEPTVRGVDAELDLQSILADTPPELRKALLLRYGARSRWDEVGREVSKSADAIRMSCEREIQRIRKKLGVQGQSE